MQSGKMKGQAFVGLSSESVAARALADTHGFLLHGRPMAVVGATQRHCVCVRVCVCVRACVKRVCV